MPGRTAKTHRESKSQPGRLRIVAGNWRRRLLDIADVPGLRPTSERIRETLFSWLAPRIDGARCLDLFAGTGALGLEALSRGAADVVFVEQSVLAAKVLRESIASLGAGNTTVHEMDAHEFLDSVARTEYDIVFLDPPFAADLLRDLCRLLTENSLLADDARIYLEEDRSRASAELPDGWEILKSKNAGNVRYSLAKPASGAERNDR